MKKGLPTSMSGRYLPTKKSSEQFLKELGRSAFCSPSDDRMNKYYDAREKHKDSSIIIKEKDTQEVK